MPSGCSISMSPPVIAFGEAVTATLDPGSATVMFAFDAEAGDRISLPRDTGNAYGRLIDPFGRIVFANNFFNNISDLLLPATERYTLLVEGFPSAVTTAPVTHEFRLEKVGFTAPPVLEGLAYVVGTTVNGTISAPGEIDHYLFTLTEPANLYFDALNYGAGALWSLTGPRGTEVTNRLLWASDGADFGSDVKLTLRAR
jgi:large repetitive protein